MSHDYAGKPLSPREADLVAELVRTIEASVGPPRDAVDALLLIHDRIGPLAMTLGGDEQMVQQTARDVLAYAVLAARLAGVIGDEPAGLHQKSS